MNLNTFLPAEWVEQDAVLLAWPHADTDWCDMLDEVVECYEHIAEAILETEPLVVVTPEVERAKADLRNIESASPNIIECQPTTLGRATSVLLLWLKMANVCLWTSSSTLGA